MGFKHLVTVKANEVIPVHKYRSERTGLTVIIGEVEGPVVNGYFTLATEAHDDDGLPHTLEHLIFLGSEKYPYKGILDLVANRCLASGTNAWTDRDHTCYTMTTAGSTGFLSLLPVYLDHILYPTLSDAGFVTEVHHITGQGEDGGVVYCEMQGRENTGESRVNLEMLRAMYPNSGYSAETGGIMSNLRSSTTNEKVRAYHAAFYRPDNLYVIITGQILNHEDIFKALEPIEEKIVSKGALPPFERPWQTPVAPLEDSTNIKIEYPADEEDCGLVNVSWRGPKATTEHKEITACSVLLRYLTDTSASPIQREFVEIEDPYASRVAYSIVENSVSLLYISFENVPIGKEDAIFDKLTQVLESIATGKEALEMQRMKNVIERYRLEALSSLESNPHDDIAFHVIGDVLYGSDEKEFENRLNTNRYLQELKDKDEAFWRALLNKYIVNSKYVAVRAVPSIKENVRTASAEQSRLEQQRKQLGENGLKEKEKLLSEAMAVNEQPPPDEMITSIPVPSTEGIKFYPVEIYSSNSGADPSGLKIADLPVYAEVYDLHTNFCYLLVTMNTEQLSAELRSYLVLLLELLTESPLRCGDKLIPYEEVVAALESSTVVTSTDVGFQSLNRFSVGAYSNTVTLSMQVIREKYEVGIELITKLLHKTEFTVERIKVCATKLVNDVAQNKREGNSIAKDILKAMYYRDDSNVRCSSMLKQSKFLASLLELIETPDTASLVIANLNKVREIITQPANLGIRMAADWHVMKALGMDLILPWKALVRSDMPSDHVKSFSSTQDWNHMMPNNDTSKQFAGCIVGLGSIESVFLFRTCQAITDFKDPDFVPLLLFLQYLTQLEGPLWRQIRGQGFAYGYSIVPRPNEGLMYFTLYRSSNVVAAYKEAVSIVEKQLGEGAEWDATLLESARSSLIFEIIARENSIEKVVDASVLASFKNVPLGYNQSLVRQVGMVNKEDLCRVGERYVKHLFSTTGTRTAIVCHPERIADIADAFKQLGYELNVQTKLEDSILA
ncbi:uncharacterized protein C05D11.1-like [Anopheles nili]|uniref:uncharacterized protein C05D11.1-like n=1 Tax=Anopheles nili TaxID=185578 RepID=UPI00237C14C0|nr:uncharacterized protein C05D11.1-like [Anopheles nili]